MAEVTITMTVTLKPTDNMYRKPADWSMGLHIRVGASSPSMGLRVRSRVRVTFYSESNTAYVIGLEQGATFKD